MIYLFINYDLFPFIELILAGLKQYETRNRNTLKQLIGKTVYLVKTGRKGRKMVYGYCTITECLKITDPNIYETYRDRT